MRHGRRQGLGKIDKFIVVCHPQILCPSARLVGRRPVINSFLWPSISTNVLGLLGDVLAQSTSHAGRLTLTVSDTALIQTHRPTNKTQNTDSDGVEVVKKGYRLPLIERRNGLAPSSRLLCLTTPEEGLPDERWQVAKY